jgi:hypothetical protein
VTRRVPPSRLRQIAAVRGQAPEAYALIDQVAIRQAQFLSYERDFQVLSFLALLCISGLPLFRHVRARHGAVAAD